MTVSLWTRMVASTVFPLHEWLKGHDSVNVRRRLEQSQWMEPETIKQLQARRLRAFLQDAGVNVPYYRDLFEAQAFRPADVKDTSDLSQLPFLTKKLIKDHAERLKSVRAGKLTRFNTGGSSGEPLVFYLGNDRISHDVAAKWRATRWWGVDIGDPEIVVWGSPIELGSQDRVRALRDRLLRSTLLPAFEMSDSKLWKFVETIRRVRPRMLFGYPSALAHVATFANRNGLRMDNLGISVAFVTAEQCSTEQKKEIADVFGCRVANGYGARDAGFIAHECTEGSLHICAEDIVVETVDMDGSPVPPGNSGEIVITHMATGSFPFIRYRTGDVGVLSETRCTCGRGLPVLEKILGRTTDFVVTPDGTVMHGLALIYVLRDLPEVEQFKIVQEARERIRVLVVPRAEWSESTVTAIQRGLSRRLGGSVAIDVEVVEGIAPEPSGKYRYVVSKVRPDQRAGSWQGNSDSIDSNVESR